MARRIAAATICPSRRAWPRRSSRPSYLYLPEQQVGLFNDRFARPLKPIKNTTIHAGRHRGWSHPHLRAFRSCRSVLGIVERFLTGRNKWQQPDEILKVRIAEGLLLQHQTPYLPAHAENNSLIEPSKWPLTAAKGYLRAALRGRCAS